MGSLVSHLFVVIILMSLNEHCAELLELNVSTEQR